ncbi:MAG TPA: hypothetical protein VGG02_02105 [Chthoniobacterales bacterium]|jgi:tetratricopeptide (TPR) repeat protein
MFRPFVFIIGLTIVFRIASAQTADLSDLLEAAKMDYANGHLDAAMAKLDQRDKAQRASGDSLDLRGSIALEQGKLALAAREFSEAHKLQPELFAPRLHLGDVDLREKKYAEAREIYTKLASDTNILTSSERTRYALLIVELASKDETAAKAAFGNIKFPTETPAYYFAEAAWAFAHHDESSAKKWIATARDIFAAPTLAWFERPLYDLGWLKEKPPPTTL